MSVTQRAFLPEADVPQTDEDGEAFLEAEAEVANPKNVTDQCELVDLSHKSEKALRKGSS